jgi:hypothetical protein
MKRITISLFAVCLIATLCYAQGARNATHDIEGKTNFTFLGLTGYNNTGNPGFIEMMGPTSDGVEVLYYLWVDTTGDLRIASYSVISAYASFPTGDWRLPNMNIGTVIGGQS